MFGSDVGSGRTELLEVIVGLKLPSNGMSSVLSLDSKEIFSGLTLGFSNPERDAVHGAAVSWTEVGNKVGSVLLCLSCDVSLPL